MAGAPRSSRKVAVRPAQRESERHFEHASWRDDDDYASSDASSATNADLSRGGPPRLTLPSMPMVPAAPPKTRDDTGSRRTLLAATGRRRALRAPSEPDYEDPAAERDIYEDTPDYSGGRRRERTTARPLRRGKAARIEELRDERYDEPRELSGPVRALAPLPLSAPELVPNLAAFRPRAVARLRVDTRRLMRSARSPWSLTRLMLAVATFTFALLTATAAVGEAAQPLMGAFQAGNGSHAAAPIASIVQAETQIERPDLYDSIAQFYGWKGAACSAAALSEVLNAWSVPHVNIGRVIDVMGPDISPSAGLLTMQGFQRGATAFGYRADLGAGYNLSYKQLLYITNYLGLPVIVNVRISWGYYHFFDGGHFLVVTGGDDQGLSIVDSSTYYIHYLQKDVFNSMFTGITAIVVPQGYRYSVPHL
jgi:hypothetical protein